MSAYRTRLVDSLRRRLTERSYARYFSPEIWEAQWSGSYQLDTAKEDARYGALIGLMRRHARGGPVLDVGCGDGLLEEQFCAALPIPVIGIDYSATAIQKALARSVPHCTFVHADYRHFEPSQRFRLIVLNESLYYVDEFLDLMRHLCRWLAEDGVFLVSMYDTRITRRIWKQLDRAYPCVQGVEVRDEGSGERWRIRVLRPGT